MLKSETKISFTDRELVVKDILKTLKTYSQKENQIKKKNFFHYSVIELDKTTAHIKVTFSKSFYIFYVVAGLITVILPFENALIGSSAFAIFIIFSAVMYFSLDYKLKTILDGFD